MIKIIDEKFLRDNPDHIFVFGDNRLRTGKGGAAKLRDEPNVYGFITKKFPNNRELSFYKPQEYHEVFEREMQKLIDTIERNSDKIYMVSKLGAGLANKYYIWEKVIEPQLKSLLSKYSNVMFLF